MAYGTKPVDLIWPLCWEGRLTGGFRGRKALIKRDGRARTPDAQCFLIGMR